MIGYRGTARHWRGTTGKARERPEVTGSGAATTQCTAQTGKANDSKNEDQQPIFRDGGVAIRELSKRESFNFVEAIVRWHAINVERRKGGNIHRVRENRSPPGSPDGDSTGVIAKVAEQERIEGREI